MWSSSCDLAFNVSKLIHMNYWSNSLNSSYCINSHNIMLANQCKDLGIIFISNLNWSPHTEMIISWQYKILKLLRRTFHTSCTNTEKQLYLSLVRSQLMYCSQLWRPNLIKDIFCLERVQRRATKYILNDFSFDYKSCLLKLNILPLMYIYKLNEILFFNKIANSPSPHFKIHHYITFSNPATRSSEHSKLLHIKCFSNSSRHLFL